MAARLGGVISPVFGFSVPPAASLIVWGVVLCLAGLSTKLLVPEPGKPAAAGAPAIVANTAGIALLDLDRAGGDGDKLGA